MRMAEREAAQAAWEVEVPDEQASARLAGKLAAAMRPPCVVYLQGDLGAGKTLFTRAYIHALGFEGYVKSPSYGLLETYRVGGQTILHLDLYRIEDPEELEYLAIRDLYGPDCVLMVEWPDRGENFLPDADLLLEFCEKGETRFIKCMPFSTKGWELARNLDGSGR